MEALAPETVHRRLLAAARPAAGFDPELDLASQRATLLARLEALLAIPESPPAIVVVERETVTAGVLERRFLVESEPGASVPCRLLVPESVASPVPVMLCLQGHTPGMHISLGRARNDSERALTDGGRDFARQALARGFAALVVELRGFGERADRRRAALRDPFLDLASQDPNVTCKHAAMVALLLGRTSLGEKILDLRAVLDAAASFPEVAGAPIYAIGNSGGGTLAWYAAAVEPRLAGLVLGSCFCTFAASIGRVDHCCDNYLPGALRWFDFPDLAMLVAPRPLVVVQGDEDPLFPLDGVETAFARANAIYAAAGAADRCRLLVVEGGHRFYPDTAWPAFLELLGDAAPGRRPS